MIRLGRIHNQDKHNLGFINIMIVLAVCLIVVAAGAFYFIRKHPEITELQNKFVGQNKDVELQQQQVRDSQRESDLIGLRAHIEYYLKGLKQPKFNCLRGKIYRSDAGTLAIDGSGWLPIDFNATPGGAAIIRLPEDPGVRPGSTSPPKNPKAHFFSFACDPIKLTFELNAILESSFHSHYAEEDGGNSAKAYEIGTDLTLMP